MNWYKIKYSLDYEEKPRDVYVEIFKAADTDDLMNKWKNFRKVMWTIVDIELLEKGEKNE